VAEVEQALLTAEAAQAEALERTWPLLRLAKRLLASATALYARGSALLQQLLDDVL